jgi:hypothetical protein
MTQASPLSRGMGPLLKGIRDVLQREWDLFEVDQDLVEEESRLFSCTFAGLEFLATPTSERVGIGDSLARSWDQTFLSFERNLSRDSMEPWLDPYLSRPVRRARAAAVVGAWLIWATALGLGFTAVVPQFVLLLLYFWVLSYTSFP